MEPPAWPLGLELDSTGAVAPLDGVGPCAIMTSTSALLDRPVVEMQIASTHRGHSPALVILDTREIPLLDRPAQVCLFSSFLNIPEKKKKKKKKIRLR